MQTQSNRYFLDGADMWDTFGLGVESGSSDFLKLPKRKESITHDWTDEDGIDIDTSRVFVEAKPVELRCHIIAVDENDFWEKYNRLQTVLTLPGIRRLSITELGRDFYVIYQECTAYSRFTRIKESNLVACKFTIKLLENRPAMNVQTFIVDEANRFIIT